MTAPARFALALAPALALGACMTGATFPRPSRALDLTAHLCPSAPPGLRVGAVGARLGGALDAAGFERAWFPAPGGFVLASRVERFGEGGAPLPGPARWAAEAPTPGVRTLGEWFRALGRDRRLRERAFLFVVSDGPVPVNAAAPAPTADAADAWGRLGAYAPGPEVEAQSVGHRHRCQALVYEFAAEVDGAPAALDPRGSLPASTHLRAAGLGSLVPTGVP